MDGAADAGTRKLTVAMWLIIPAVAFIALLTMATFSKGGIARPGEPAPPLEGSTLDGAGRFSLEDVRGKPVFVNFWWSGCVPCKEEAPILARAHDVYGDDVAFVGVNVRDAKTDALAFAERNDLDFTHVRDPALDIYRRYGLTGQPESFFIDRDGVIVEHVPGPVDEEALGRLLEVLASRDA